MIEARSISSDPGYMSTRQFTGIDGNVINLPPMIDSYRAVNTFDQETQKTLMERGNIIINLTAQPISETRAQAARLGIQSTMGDHAYESSTSLAGEIAINPHRLFLPESNNLTFAEQYKLVADDSAVLTEEVPFAKSIIASAADYNAIMIELYSRTGLLLFGANFDHGYTRTSDGFGLGAFTTGNGIRMSQISPELREPWLSVAPLTVPHK